MSETPRSLKRKITPPPTRKTSIKADNFTKHVQPELEPRPAAVEAGKADVTDHVGYWTAQLRNAQRPTPKHEPRISLAECRRVYERNQNEAGHHFVIHQHDHPVSGVHYDLRLQFSNTSSLSWSIPYGVPGNANSLRPNRMAIETRVHNVWNNLIESASRATGSLLIWDTGEYEVRPRPSRVRRSKETDDEHSGASDLDESMVFSSQSEPDKLRYAFHDRHIHLRLHGSRLPEGYTIALRLPSQSYRARQPRAPKRRRRARDSPPPRKGIEPETSASDTGTSASTVANVTAEESTDLKAAAAASDDEGDSDARERERIRVTNAYPGATNDIGSVHQRQWFLSLDRTQSGFVKGQNVEERGRWVRDGIGGFEPFVVRGREDERSIVTGRLAAEVMEDAGITGYKGRKMWIPISQ